MSKGPATRPAGSLPPARDNPGRLCHGVGMEFTNWRKSSHSFSNGNCLEAASWRTSSHSNGTECAEIGHGPGIIGVRDTKNPGGPVLEFTAAAWRAFTTAAKAGHLAH